MWPERVKIDAKKEEEDYLNNLDDWEQNTLKEANPNWNDPETFFERMEKQAQPGNAKKGGKK